MKPLLTRLISGDLKRPSCSRCLEGGSPCSYSSTKRKPGPVKGSRRKVARSRLSEETRDSWFFRSPRSRVECLTESNPEYASPPFRASENADYLPLLSPTEKSILPITEVVCTM